MVKLAPIKEKTTLNFAMNEREALDKALRGGRFWAAFCRETTIHERKTVLGMYVRQLEKEINEWETQSEGKTGFEAKVAEDRLKDLNNKYSEAVDKLWMYGGLAKELGFKTAKLYVAHKVLFTLGITPTFFNKRKALWMLEHRMPVTSENLDRKKKDLLQSAGVFNKRKEEEPPVVKPSKDRKSIALIWHAGGYGAYFGPREIEAYADHDGKRVEMKDATGRNDLAPIYSLQPVAVINPRGVLLRMLDTRFEVIAFAKEVPERAIEKELRTQEQKLISELSQFYDKIDAGDKSILGKKAEA